ncbi:MAG: DUF2087 domain-containing protein [Anaerolineae bacterium]|nr:DUF2087 domain-containing protein [Anaerolineae bacterium]
MQRLLGQLKLVELAPPTSNDAWMDALGFTEDEKRVLKDYTFNGAVTQLPPKQKKLLVVLRWIAPSFAADRSYTEAEVNQILTRFHPDYAHLRRYLVEYGFLRRERGGGKYWLAPEEE